MENEKRLIDANALKREFSTIADRSNLDYIFIDVISDAIEDAPTVDAVEVVQGRWLSNGMCNHKPSRFRNPDKWTIYKCSECGYSNGRKFNANYCPNCGAKMDGERKDNDRSRSKGQI